jgi:hypothetical protein
MQQGVDRSIVANSQQETLLFHFLKKETLLFLVFLARRSYSTKLLGAVLLDSEFDNDGKKDACCDGMKCYLGLMHSGDPWCFLLFSTFRLQSVQYLARHDQQKMYLSSSWMHIYFCQMQTLGRRIHYFTALKNCLHDIWGT